MYGVFPSTLIGFRRKSSVLWVPPLECSHQVVRIANVPSTVPALLSGSCAHRCLHVELESIEKQLKEAMDQSSASKEQEKKLRFQIKDLELLLAAAKQTRAMGMGSKGIAYSAPELETSLATYKIKLAQAEYQMLELQKELRTSRRMTQEG